MKLYKNFATLFVSVLIINLVIAGFLFTWATDDDFTNLSKNPAQRYIELVYFCVTTFTTTGYGDVVPVSLRARITMTFTMLVVFTTLVTIITHVF